MRFIHSENVWNTILGARDMVVSWTASYACPGVVQWGSGQETSKPITPAVMSTTEQVNRVSEESVVG